MKSLRGRSKAYDINDNLKDEFSVNIDGKKYPLLSKNFTGFVNKTTKTGKTLINKVLSGTKADKEKYIMAVSSVLNLDQTIYNSDVKVKNKNVNYDTMVLKNQKNSVTPGETYIYQQAQTAKNNEEADQNNEEYEKELEKIRQAQAYNEYVQKQQQAQNAPQKFAKGGKVTGKSHENGGVKMKLHKQNKDVELEGGEYVINKEAVKHFEDELTKINKIGLELRDGKNNDKRDKIRKKILDLKNKKNEYDEFLGKLKNTQKFEKGELLNLTKILNSDPDVKEEFYNMYLALKLMNRRKLYNDEPELFEKYIKPFISNDEALKLFHLRTDIRYGYDDIKLKEYEEKYGKIKNDVQDNQKEQAQEQEKEQEKQTAISNAILSDSVKPTTLMQQEKIAGHDISNDGVKDSVNKLFPELQKYVDMFTNKDADFSAIMKHFILNNKITELNKIKNEILKLINKLSFIDINDSTRLKTFLLSKNDNTIKSLYFNLKALEKCKEIYDKNKNKKDEVMESGKVQKGAVVSIKSFGGPVKASDVSANINKNGSLDVDELEANAEKPEPVYKVVNQGQQKPDTTTFNELSLNKNLIDEQDTKPRNTLDLASAYYNVYDRYQGRYSKDIQNIDDEFKNNLNFRLKNNKPKKGRKNLSII